MPRDFTKYEFNGQIYGKGRLVLAVIQDYVIHKKPSLKDFAMAFPTELQGRKGLFCTENEFKEKLNYSNDVKKRFFTKEDEAVEVKGTKVFISTQWGEGNIPQFIAQAESLGFTITTLIDDSLNNFYHRYFDSQTIEYLSSQEQELQQAFVKAYEKVRFHFPQCDIYTTYNHRDNYRLFAIGIKPGSKRGKPKLHLGFESGTVYLYKNKSHFDSYDGLDLAKDISQIDNYIIALKDKISNAMMGNSKNPKDYIMENSEGKTTLSNSRKQSLNQILYGPPGTGKTYHTIEAAVTAAEPGFNWDDDRDLLKAEYERLVADGRIRFVTFHQSYGYEEFVEGLSAKTNDGVLSYFEKDGVFKSICDDAKNNMLDSEKSLEQLSTESQFDQALEVFKLSVFDDRDEYRLTDACSITAIEHDGLRYGGNWQSAPIMKYADLKQLYLSGVETRQDIKKSELVSGLAKQHASYFIRALEAIKKHISSDNTAHLHTDKQNYVLIIDEINRGNMSKIFGELITLIEPSKRFGQPEALEATLPYSGAAFSVPDNLYLIGTMNTADRSLALMDTALRRRFDFVEMMPDYKALGDKKLRVDDVEIDIARLLEALNKRIEVLYDREHTLGHAFLIPVKQHLDADDHSAAFDELVSTFQNKIVPLLEEYFFEDWNKIRLIFGDNKKKDNGLSSYVLIGEQESSYDEIFGVNHGLDSYEQKKVTYEVASFYKEDSPWKKPQSYVAIYDEKVLLATLNKLKTIIKSEVND